MPKTVGCGTENAVVKQSNTHAAIIASMPEEIGCSIKKAVVGLSNN